MVKRISLKSKLVVLTVQRVDMKKYFTEPKLKVEELTIALSQTKAELYETNEKLKQTERNRSELFANISHDLRSPLTALKSTVEYMASLDNYDKVEMKYLIDVMSSRIHILENLVNESYLLTTLENTAIPLQYEIVGIGSFLEEFFYTRLADSKYDNRNLILNVPEQFEYPVKMDTGCFERVLDNLFTNALKYSDDGALIKLSARKADGRINIEIQDTGRGINQTEVNKIFERAYQVEKSRTPDVKRGSGLGLAIVKLILNRHQADIRCESEYGKGSKFIISIPLAEDGKEVLDD